MSSWDIFHPTVFEYSSVETKHPVSARKRLTDGHQQSTRQSLLISLQERKKSADTSVISSINFPKTGRWKTGVDTISLTFKSSLDAIFKMCLHLDFVMGILYSIARELKSRTILETGF